MVWIRVVFVFGAPNAAPPCPETIGQALKCSATIKGLTKMRGIRVDIVLLSMMDAFDVFNTNTSISSTPIYPTMGGRRVGEFYALPNNPETGFTIRSVIGVTWA